MRICSYLSFTFYSFCTKILFQYRFYEDPLLSKSIDKLIKKKYITVHSSHTSVAIPHLLERCQHIPSEGMDCYQQVIKHMEVQSIQ